MKRITHALNWLLLILIAVIAAGIIIAVWLYAFDANPAIVISNSPVPVDKTAYRAGDIIVATFDYCRYTNAPARRYATFNDGLLLNVPPVDIPGLGVGCWVKQAGVAVVPPSLPPGHYYITGKHELRVNFLATRIVEWRTAEFDIVK